MFIMLDLKKSQFKANKVKVEAVIYGQCSETFGHNFFWEILRREFYCCNSIYFFNDLRGFLLLSMHEITLAWIYFRGAENFLLFLRICSWKRTVVFFAPTAANTNSEILSCLVHWSKFRVFSKLFLRLLIARTSGEE